ncbi:hypothetical protein [Ruegeria sp.]|uniref:hypothetical protein n=1 Tax=Ruegeria sp. TaxID=1879320 RepID=UPI003B5BB5C8
MAEMTRHSVKFKTVAQLLSFSLIMKLTALEAEGCFYEVPSEDCSGFIRSGSRTLKGQAGRDFLFAE